MVPFNLLNGYVRGSANAVSADGSVVVGNVTDAANHSIAYYWDRAIVWLDDHRVAVAGIGIGIGDDEDEDEDAIVPGARIFDVTRRGKAAPGWSSHAPRADELLAFAGRSGMFFSEGGWLFSSSDTGLSRWDPRPTIATRRRESHGYGAVNSGR